jgi:hypothetical protein
MHSQYIDKLIRLTCCGKDGMHPRGLIWHRHAFLTRAVSQSAAMLSWPRLPELIKFPSLVENADRPGFGNLPAANIRCAPTRTVEEEGRKKKKHASRLLAWEAKLTKA